MVAPAAPFATALWCLVGLRLYDLAISCWIRHTSSLLAIRS
jgi:hypothetical protein